MGVLRKSVQEVINSRIKKDPTLIGSIINYSKDSPPFKILIKETSKNACLKYREIMLEKHPHLNKKPVPKHHSRLRAKPR